MVPMKKVSSSLALKLALVIALWDYSSIFCHAEINIFGVTKHVYVINSLSAGNTLSVHCKSKDDDLGQHDIPFNGVYEWKFKMQAFERTLYWCNAWWYDHHKLVSRSFEIFRAEDVDRSCGPDHKLCHRKFQWDGIYFEKEDGTFAKKFDWVRK
ncbi:hypothetical protein FRX31_021512 [Thalictrum thalictroides]|uniref:S-protein homolog n=1 Tax=Thalictrum thalictroides TaxID=46969 RepID=A0A7J6VVP6_THATH|nr:hypothetical protein FRX31_021512 [Thalictrum thalictroides]